MKTILGWIAFGSTAMFASEPVVPAFPETKIEVPALPLLDAARQQLPPVFGPISIRQARQRALPKIVSRMPIIPPLSGNADASSVKQPDESKDYKLLVIPPTVVSVK